MKKGKSKFLISYLYLKY